MFAAQRDEQVASSDFAAVGRDRSEAHIEADQPAIQRLCGLREQHHAGALHARSAASAIATSLNECFTPLIS
jgi:hypothetical protein